MSKASFSDTDADDLMSLSTDSSVYFNINLRLDLNNQRKNSPTMRGYECKCFVLLEENPVSSRSRPGSRPQSPDIFIDTDADIEDEEDEKNDCEKNTELLEGEDENKNKSKNKSKNRINRDDRDKDVLDFISRNNRKGLKVLEELTDDEN